MKTTMHFGGFSDEYGQLRRFRSSAEASVAHESHPEMHEDALQGIWCDQLFPTEALFTHDGRPIRVLSPGWRNRAEGPDFRHAQIEIQGRLLTGDIEVHFRHSHWRGHSHHVDPRYDGVILVVVAETEPPEAPPRTSQNRPIPCLMLGKYLKGSIESIPETLPADLPAGNRRPQSSRCGIFTETYGPDPTARLLALAGEWRMLGKARRLREQMDRAGDDQAIYEAFLGACGFSRYKHHFQMIARHLPYERARQLALRNPMLLEAALLQIAGLLPDPARPDAGAAAHPARLLDLKNAELAGLRPLPLSWIRSGVRPANYPERRLGSAALFVARIARKGLTETLDPIWSEDVSPRDRRRELEKLFPPPLGFWATHYSWTGQPLPRPAAPFGKGRIRSIIGNVFVPAALAKARRRKDRLAEERIFAFFASLSKEPDNARVRAMLPRFFGSVKPPRLNFRSQQGLLQIFEDWCEGNPSCRNCPVVPYLSAVGTAIGDDRSIE